MLGDEEMIAILEEIARSGKSHGARIDAIKQLRAIRAEKDGGGGDAPEEKKPEDGFAALHAVDNPGRVRRAS